MSLDTPFWGPDFDALTAEDPEIAGVILGELDRLRAGHGFVEHLEAVPDHQG